MAAVTSTILAAGGLGLSAAQMVNANKKNQQAQDAKKLAATTLKGTKQANAFKSLQSPDISSYSRQANLQSQAQSVQALQEMGPEGAAMIANIDQGARASNLQTAERQAGMDYQRDAAQAQAQQGINRDQYITDTNLSMTQLEGAQQEEINAQMQKQAAISGIFGSLGQMATGLGDAVPLYREKKANAGPVNGGSVTGSTANNFNSPVQNQPQGFDWMWNNGQ